MTGCVTFACCYRGHMVHNCLLLFMVTAIIFESLWTAPMYTLTLVLWSDHLPSESVKFFTRIFVTLFVFSAPLLTRTWLINFRGRKESTKLFRRFFRIGQKQRVLLATPNQSLLNYHAPVAVMSPPPPFSVYLASLKPSLAFSAV